MSVSGGLTLKLIKDESRGPNWWRAVLAASIGGDGSGGTLSCFVDVPPYIKAGDLVWFDDATLVTDDTNAATFGVVVNGSQWSAYQSASVTASLGEKATAPSIGGNIATIKPATPVYLGTPLDAASCAITAGIGINTNTKTYNMIVRLLVYRSPTLTEVARNPLRIV